MSSRAPSTPRNRPTTAPARPSEPAPLVWLATALALVLVATGTAAAAVPPPPEKFGPPILIEELNTERQEKSPCISTDGRELWFHSNRVEGAQVVFWVYVAKRPSLDAPFAAPERVVVDAANPDISWDGRTLLFVRDTDPAPETLDIDLFRMRRESPEGDFGEAEPIDELNSPFKDASPTTTADELEIWFHSDRPGSVGETDLWTASRNHIDEPFGPPVPVAGLNTAGQELTPSVSPDGRTLYFASDRPGGRGGMDIWVARRATRDDPFGPAENVREVNGKGTEKACDISADGLCLFLRTKSVSGEGQSEMAVAVDARSGNVQRGVGPGFDVLTVNGANGGRDRVVRIAPFETIRVDIEASPVGPASARYALYALPLSRGAPTPVPQPFDVGTTAFSTPLDGKGPMPVVVANLFASRPRGDRLGMPRFADPPRAPTVVLERPAGAIGPTSLLIQGFIEDRGAPGPNRIAVTNAVEIHIE